MLLPIMKIRIKYLKDELLDVITDIKQTAHLCNNAEMLELKQSKTISFEKMGTHRVINKKIENIMKDVEILEKLINNLSE